MFKLVSSVKARPERLKEHSVAPYFLPAIYQARLSKSINLEKSVTIEKSSYVAMGAQTLIYSVA